MTDLWNYFPIFSEDEDEIRARMDADVNLNVDPSSEEWVDTRQGGFYWDMSQLFLLEFARLWDALGTEVSAASSPLTAWGLYLENHAGVFNLTRKDAVAATGYVILSGTEGTLVPSQFEVGATPTSADVEAPEYQTLDSAVIAVEVAAPGTISHSGSGSGGALATATYYYKITAINDVGETTASAEASQAITGPTGKVTLSWAAVTGATGYRIYRSTGTGTEKLLTETMAISWVDDGALTPDGVTSPPVVNTTGGAARVAVECKTTGLAGNVAIGAIAEILTPLDGVLSVTNLEAITGGAETESDDALRARLLLEYRGSGAGNIADHQRWALAFDGVGRVTVFPVYNSIAGQVGVALMDANGDPVSQVVVDAYQEYIDPVAGQGHGVAPIGQTVIVFTPTATAIDIVATVTFKENYGLDSDSGVALRDTIESALAAYVDALQVGDDVVYNHVLAQFFTVTGVFNVSGLTVEGGSSNVSINDTHVAQFGSATLA